MFLNDEVIGEWLNEIFSYLFPESQNIKNYKNEMWKPEKTYKVWVKIRKRRLSWDEVEPPGTSWNYLEQAKTIWNELEPPGTMWNKMDSATNWHTKKENHT